MTTFTNELEGQQQFFLKYLPIIDNSLTADDILTDYTDGVVRGNIIEFKLVITDLTHTLSQTIKYLSAMRIKGRSIPSNIILVSLNTETAYLYHSNDYLTDIEKVYMGSASSGIDGFSADKYLEKLEYGKKDRDEFRLINLLRSEEYTKINIDENCIVGWGERFYKENPTFSKSAFVGDTTGNVKIVGEIRRPTHFKDLIHPYVEGSNVRFQYLMDKLNDHLNRKNLGAYYTPIQYAEKSYELLYKAIERVPEGNDYIILDRCAGTGNLEENLPDEILSHCVLSTIEYYEYKVLIELLGDKVRYIIPPTEKEDTFQAGLVRGADALSEDYLNNEVLQDFVNDPKMSIIIFENPPYVETTGVEHQKMGVSASSSSWKDNKVVLDMKEEISGASNNDMANAFIWSAFRYYLRRPTDSLIVYSPIKYWKNQHLINKKFLDGFAFNRKHFHTKTNAMISCILWANEEENTINEFDLKAYDLDKQKNLVDEGIIKIKRIYNKYSEYYYDKRAFNTDVFDGIAVGLDGLERKATRVSTIYNDNMVGYIVSHKAGLDNPRLSGCLLIAGRYDANGFFLRKDNLIEKLPMFSAARYTDHDNNWKIMSQLMKSADGHLKYHEDVSSGKLDNFLLKNLLWCSLTHYSHMRSLYGSDGRFYRNEISLDTTNGDTLATILLKDLDFNSTEKKLIEQFNSLMIYAKETKNYNPDYTYSLYQIDEELNTKTKDLITNKNIPDYPLLQGEINSLKKNVKKYYLNEIAPTLFEYEFLK